MLRRRQGAACIVVLALLALPIGACGSDDESSTSTPAAKSGSVAAQVPESVRAKGTLKVASDATYPPDEFIGADGKTVEGMDPDLAAALAGVMGLEAKVVNATFDNIIPGLAAGKYDLGMSSFTDTKEREKTVDFVTYFASGTSFYVKAQSGTAVNSLADLCGKTVAVEKGTTQQNDATAQAERCSGETVKVLTFPDQNGANLALSSGRAQVGMADSQVAAYQVKRSSGQFKLTGKPYGTVRYGIAIPKGSGLAKPVLAALKELMSNGRYAAILKKWGIQEGAIDNPTINGATS